MPEELAILDVSEKFTNGQATSNELHMARIKFSHQMRNVISFAVFNTTLEIAWRAAWETSSNALRAAGWKASWGMNSYEAGKVAWDTAVAQAVAKQEELFIKHFG